LHEIPLTAGWQIISTFLDPKAPDTAVPTIVSDIEDNMKLMFDIEGKIYFPDFNINNIGNWNVKSGYKIKMDAVDTLLIAGDPLADNDLNYDEGSYYMPVLTDQTIQLVNAFQNPTQDIISITDLRSGQFYWPEGGIFTNLTELTPGLGYLASFNKAVTVTYPDYQGYNTDEAIHYATAPEGPWTVNRTSEVHLIAIDYRSFINLDGADYVGAFDNEGNCLGFAHIDNATRNAPMVIYGDDSWTEAKDGAVEGEKLHFVSYNSATGIEAELTAEFDPNQLSHDGNYQSNGRSIITDFFKSSTGISGGLSTKAVRMYPNPATNMVTIEVEAEQTTRIDIVNAEGMTMKSVEMIEGKTSIRTSELAKGVYFVKIYLPTGSTVKKLVIQ
jgi:hypothetical protein